MKKIRLLAVLLSVVFLFSGCSMGKALSEPADSSSALVEPSDNGNDVFALTAKINLKDVFTQYGLIFENPGGLSSYYFTNIRVFKWGESLRAQYTIKSAEIDSYAAVEAYIGSHSGAKDSQYSKWAYGEGGTVTLNNTDGITVAYDCVLGGSFDFAGASEALIPVNIVTLAQNYRSSICDIRVYPSDGTGAENLSITIACDTAPATFVALYKEQFLSLGLVERTPDEISYSSDDTVRENGFWIKDNGKSNLYIMHQKNDLEQDRIKSIEAQAFPYANLSDPGLYPVCDTIASVSVTGSMMYDFDLK